MNKREKIANEIFKQLIPFGYDTFNYNIVLDTVSVNDRMKVHLGVREKVRIAVLENTIHLIRPEMCHG
jgi:hypothetical protein